MIVAELEAASSAGRPASRGSAAFSGVTSSRSTKPGCEPSAAPVKHVPERGEPTTKTSRSSRPSGAEAAAAGDADGARGVGAGRADSRMHGRTVTGRAGAARDGTPAPAGPRGPGD